MATSNVIPFRRPSADPQPTKQPLKTRPVHEVSDEDLQDFISSMAINGYHAEIFETLSIVHRYRPLLRHGEYLYLRHNTQTEAPPPTKSRKKRAKVVQP